MMHIHTMTVGLENNEGKLCDIGEILNIKMRDFEISRMMSSSGKQLDSNIGFQNPLVPIVPLVFLLCH